MDTARSTEAAQTERARVLVNHLPAFALPANAKAEGARFNKGKLRYDLLPPDALEKVVEVLTKGAAKYSQRNWERGLKWNEGCYASLMRHLQSWAQGQELDSETSCPHLAHVVTNALFLLTFQLRGVGEDDRAVRQVATMDLST